MITSTCKPFTTILINAFHYFLWCEVSIVYFTYYFYFCNGYKTPWCNYKPWASIGPIKWIFGYLYVFQVVQVFITIVGSLGVCGSIYKKICNKNYLSAKIAKSCLATFAIILTNFQNVTPNKKILIMPILREVVIFALNWVHVVLGRTCGR